MSEQLVEAVARAIWDDVCRLMADAGQTPPEGWGDNLNKEHLFSSARAALAAIEASGTHAVVPVDLCLQSDELIKKYRAEAIANFEAAISYLKKAGP